MQNIVVYCEGGEEVECMSPQFVITATQISIMDLRLGLYELCHVSQLLVNQAHLQTN